MILNDDQWFFLHVLWVLTKEKIKFFFKNQLESQGEPIIGFPFFLIFLTINYSLLLLSLYILTKN